MIKNLLFTILLILPFFYCKSYAQDGNKLVDVKIISEYENFSKGKNRIGLLFKIENGWHIYWKNSGDSGLPTKFEWEVHDNVVISDGYYPVPKRIPFGNMANFGYEDEVVIFFDLFLKDAYNEDQLKLNVRINWLVCKEKCLSGKAQISELFKIKSKSPESENSLIMKKFTKLLPVKKEFNASAELKDDKIILSIKETPPEEILFFPYTNGIYNHGANQKLISKNNQYLLHLPLDNYRIEEPESVNGVLKIKQNNKYYFYEIFVPLH